MRIILIGAVAMAAGCTTWGVEAVERTVDVTDERAVGAATGVRIDGIATESTLEIRGGGVALAASLDVTAWVADAADVDPERDLRVEFRREGDGAIEVDPRYGDGIAEHITLEAMRLRMPDGLDLDVETAAGDVVVQGVSGSVQVTTPGDAITVSDVGPITLASSLGTITAAVAHGGGIETGGGSADVTITGNDFDLLTVDGGSGGSIAVHLPPDLPLTLDLLASGEEGSVSIAVAGGRILESGTQRLLSLNGGGPLVYVRTTDATITIDEVADR